MVWSTTDGGWIYAVREEGTPLIKIGYTRCALRTRLSALRSELRPSAITLVAVVRVECGARFAEEGIHLLLRAQHIQGEWFYLYMTQELLESLAKRMTLLWKILHGDRPQVSAITVKRLTRGLGVSTDYLLGMDIPDSEVLPTAAELVGA